MGEMDEMALFQCLCLCLSLNTDSAAGHRSTQASYP